METIEALWQEHQAARFPYDMGGREVAGVCVTMLDADIAGCVSSFVGRRPTDPRRGSLDSERAQLLRRRRSELVRVIPSLPPDARPYFERLADLADRVLAELSGHPSGAGSGD